MCVCVCVFFIDVWGFVWLLKKLGNWLLLLEVNLKYRAVNLMVCGEGFDRLWVVEMVNDGL